MTLPRAHRDKLKPDIWREETKETFEAAPRTAPTLPHFQVTAHITGYIAQLFQQQAEGLLCGLFSFIFVVVGGKKADL